MDKKLLKMRPIHSIIGAVRVILLLTAVKYKTVYRQKKREFPTQNVVFRSWQCRTPCGTINLNNTEKRFKQFSEYSSYCLYLAFCI